jgi:hypothetical protein
MTFPQFVHIINTDRSQRRMNMWYWYFGWWYLPLRPPAKVIYVDFKRRRVCAKI